MIFYELSYQNETTDIILTRMTSTYNCDERYGTVKGEPRHTFETVNAHDIDTMLLGALSNRKQRP